MYAKEEKEKLISVFGTFEVAVHATVTFIYSCCIVLLVPFIQIYTRNISDINYVVPAFAIVLSLSQAIYCIRIPYNIVVKAAGHYKQTQMSALIEMMINIIISISFVIKFGLIGISIGTMCAMIFRTIYLALYSTKKILLVNSFSFYKNLAIDILTMIISFLLTRSFHIEKITYFDWAIMAIRTAFICGIITMIMQLLFNIKVLKNLKKYVINKTKGDRNA